MIAVIRTTGGRIALAIVLSLLIHASILWLPYLTLPHPGVQLPPLTVTLEALPQPVKLHAKQPQRRKPAVPKEMRSPEPGSSIRSTDASMPPLEKTRQTAATQPFPKHLQLTFAVYDGEHGSRTGEIRDQLDLGDGRYTLRSVRQTSGLASLRDRGLVIRTSNGKIVAAGLEPDTYEVETDGADGKLVSRSQFNHETGTIRFQDGTTAALPADTQDDLSFEYQLSQLSMQEEILTLPVSDTAQLHPYQFEIGARENVDTPLGKLRALHLIQMHNTGDAYFEIWLGLEYRRLPVKLRWVDSTGKETEEAVVSDIRVSDE